MPPVVESAQFKEAGLPEAAAGRNGAGPRELAPLAFFFTAGVLLYTYFDVYHHYWLLKWVDGYVVKAWLPPALLLLFALWQIRRHVSLPNRFAGLTFPTLFLGAYILFGSISLAWHEDLSHAVKYGLMMFGPVMVYLAVILLFRDNRCIEKVLLVMFGAGVLLSAYVYYMYEIRGYMSWIGEPLTMRWMWTRQEAHEVLQFNYYISYGYFAYTKTLKLIDEPAFSAMLAPLVLFGFLRSARSSSWKRWGFFILNLVLLYTLIGTASRSSFVALVAALVPFLWFIRRQRLQVLLIVISIAALLYQQPFMLYRTGLLAGAAASQLAKLADDSQVPLVISTLKKLDNAIAERMPVQKDGHIESILKTLERARANPMLGYGVGKLINEHSTPESRWRVEHDRYLFILSTAGLLTAVPYFLFVLSLLWLAWKAVLAGRGSRDADGSIGILMLSAVFFFTLQLNNCGQERYYYWVFFGLAAAWIRNTTLTESHENPSH